MSWWKNFSPSGKLSSGVIWLTPWTCYLILWLTSVCLWFLLAGCGPRARAERLPWEHDTVEQLTVSYHEPVDSRLIQVPQPERNRVCALLRARLLWHQAEFAWRAPALHVMSYPYHVGYVPSGYPNSGGSTNCVDTIWLDGDGHYLAHELHHCYLFARYPSAGIRAGDPTHSHETWGRLRRAGLY